MLVPSGKDVPSIGRGYSERLRAHSLNEQLAHPHAMLAALSAWYTNRMHLRRSAPWAATLMSTAVLVAACTSANQADTTQAGTHQSGADHSATTQSTSDSERRTPSTPSPIATQSPPLIPPVSDAASAVGLIDVRSVATEALIDPRYTTADNFVGVALYPEDARCLVHESIGPGLKKAETALRDSNEVLVFWDCYRPHSVQQKMFDKVPNPAWVAAPGDYSRSHESGRSVDVSLAAHLPDCPADRRIADLCMVDLGTDFDSFTPEATAFAVDGVPAAAGQARARLRDAMAAGGLTIYAGEWWHFDGDGADVARPIIDVPLT